MGAQLAAVSGLAATRAQPFGHRKDDAFDNAVQFSHLRSTQLAQSSDNLAHQYLRG